MSWDYVTLDRLGKISRGKSKHRPRNDASLFGGDYPFIQTADIKAAGMYLTKYSETYNDKGLAQSKIWPKGTLCITIAANIADTAILGIDACFPDSVMGFIPYKDIANVKFVKYSFDILQRDCKNISQGTAQDNLSWKKLSTIKFPMPSLDIQNKIADILSTYDNLIENNQKQIKLLEEAAQRLYKEWFVDLRFPGHENVEIVDGIPLGWHEDTIDTKVNLLNGFAFKSNSLEETGLFKLVTIKNVQDGYFEGKNVKYLPKIPDKMPRHCHLNEGDILLSLTGNVGRVCIVEGNNFLLNQRVAKISSDTPAYTYCLFRSNDLFVKINNISNGAAQQNVSTIRIGQIKHWFPNDKLIMDFERLVSPILKRVVLMKKNIILLEEARDRLLPKLMSGEIEV